MIQQSIKILVCYSIVGSIFMISLISGNSWNFLYNSHVMSVLLMTWLEIDRLRKLRFCTSKESLEWLHQNTFTECILFGVLFMINLIVMGVMQVMDSQASWVEFTQSVFIYLALMLVCLLTISSGSSHNFDKQLMPMNFNKARGFQYRLPCWYLLPRELRIRLLGEMYKKAPIEGQTHLFISKGLFRTTVKIMTADSGELVPDFIPKDLLEYLERHPKVTIRNSFSDDMLSILRKRRIPRLHAQNSPKV